MYMVINKCNSQDNHRAYRRKPERSCSFTSFSSSSSAAIKSWWSTVPTFFADYIHHRHNSIICKPWPSKHRPRIYHFLSFRLTVSSAVVLTTTVHCSASCRRLTHRQTSVQGKKQHCCISDHLWNCNHICTHPYQIPGKTPKIDPLRNTDQSMCALSTHLQHVTQLYSLCREPLTSSPWDRHLH